VRPEGEDHVRIAIISDLHANLAATEAVLHRIQLERVDRIVCLGDVVGYGGRPNEVCDLVRENADRTILGNHDAAVTGLMDYTNYYQAARDALDWTLFTLRPDNLKWLSTRSYSANEDERCYSHGSPIYPEAFDYVFNLDLAGAHCRFFDRMNRVTFMGHTHLTRCWRLSDQRAHDVPAGVFQLDQDSKYLVTVGSVGQPRDYDPRACFVIYDSEDFRVKHVRVPYNIQSAAQNIRQAGLSDHFARRLSRGV
jgi:diadenosine tetraphosphatase ApaH/serine/threonine PP2A family protein phosphatase